MFLPTGATRENPVPFVLMTHGWAGSRITDANNPRVKTFLDAGYGVLTWDSRGFGASGGSVQLNSPDYEVRDVQTLVTYVARNIPASLKTGPLDPVVGMSGGSYAGGIQLLAAAHDTRIDAIAPEITWNDLVQSLAPNGVPKLYWTSLLLGSGAEASCVNARNGDTRGAVVAIAPVKFSDNAGCQTNDLADYYARVHATNGVPDDVREALLKRSPATYMDDIRIPTLLIQGFPDTLFDVDQAVANYNGIKANGAPVKLWLYDGGHAHPENAAPVPNTQGVLIPQVVLSWFECHLRPLGTCNTGPEVEYWDGAAWQSADSWPVPMTERTIHYNGIPAIFGGPQPTSGNQGSFTVNLQAGSPDGETLAVGNARVEFLVGSQAPEAIGFVSLGIRSGGVVTRVNDQVQPFRTEATTVAQTRVTVDLVDVLAKYGPGQTLVLTFSAVDQNYNGNRVPGPVFIEDIDITWYTVDPTQGP